MTVVVTLSVDTVGIRMVAVFVLWESLKFPLTGGDPPEDAHGGETVRLPPVLGPLYLSSSLKRHQRVHTGETLQLSPHQHHLKMHLKVHTE
jgi:hypothetical protein